MKANGKTIDDVRIAEEIVSVLPAGSVARVCSDDRETIRYAVRNAAMKLTTVVFSRASLRRLLEDCQRAIKIEYLRRDLVRNAQRKGEYRYPRPAVHPSKKFRFVTAKAAAF